MKKILIFIVGVLLLLTSCNKVNNFKLEIESISIASNFSNQIQNIDNLRLDRIVLDLKYTNGNRQNIILKEDMIDKKDILKLDNIGIHKITLNDKYLNLEFDFVIYDDEYIEHKYIYYYKQNNSYKIYSFDNIDVVEEPIRDGYYFKGWYNSDLSIPYIDGDEKIVELFALWSDSEVYEIVFDNKGDRTRYYLASGEKIVYPEINDSKFFSWNRLPERAFSDMVITAKYKTDDHVGVRYFDENNELINCLITKKGNSVNFDVPVIEVPNNYYATWSDNTDCVMEDMDVYLIIKPIKKQVNFYDTNGNLLDSYEASIGDSLVFEYDTYLYQNVSFSEILEPFNPVSWDVIVYFSPYVFDYYFDETSYESNLSIYEAPPIPELEGCVGKWVQDSENHTIFRLVYERIGEENA